MANDWDDYEEEDVYEEDEPSGSQETKVVVLVVGGLLLIALMVVGVLLFANKSDPAPVPPTIAENPAPPVAPAPVVPPKAPPATPPAPATPVAPPTVTTTGTPVQAVDVKPLFELSASYIPDAASLEADRLVDHLFRLTTRYSDGILPRKVLDRWTNDLDLVLLPMLVEETGGHPAGFSATRSYALRLAPGLCLVPETVRFQKGTHVLLRNGTEVVVTQITPVRGSDLATFADPFPATDWQYATASQAGDDVLLVADRHIMPAPVRVVADPLDGDHPFTMNAWYYESPISSW